jgi:CRISPR type I-D-associated protein Csc2
MSTINMPAGFVPLKDYFVETPQPILSKETIQIVLMREALDYTIFRTEETREINKVLTPVSIQKADEQMERVAFLASKQKAVESRELAQVLRTATTEQGVKVHECWLKDHLCLQCPRCTLFGGTNASASKLVGKSLANIKHRIAYSTAFSLADYHEVQEAITFNAIDNSRQSTGSPGKGYALGARNVVKPATLFPSIVSLQSVTWKEFMLALKAILGARRYGAESRIGGDMRNTVFGIVAGWEEIITPLEFTLELCDRQSEGITPETVTALLQDYARDAAHRAKVKVLSADDVETLVNEVRTFELNQAFLTSAYDAAEAYRKGQDEKPKSRPKK